MAQLSKCPHCGAEVEFVQVDRGRGVFAKCTNCGIQTPTVFAALEHSAMEKVAELWNSNKEEEWAAWIQPKGAHDAYPKGSKVSHKSKRWISNLDANVWEPGVTGWTEQK